MSTQTNEKNKIVQVIATYHCVEGKSQKFWELNYIKLNQEIIRSIGTDGEYTIEYRWGRIGSLGQVKIDRFRRYDLLTAAANKKVTEKLNKGYKLEREVQKVPSALDPLYSLFYKNITKKSKMTFNLGKLQTKYNDEWVNKLVEISADEKKALSELEYDPDDEDSQELLNSWFVGILGGK